MTVKFVAETVATSHAITTPQQDSEQPILRALEERQVTAATVARPGMLIAGLVLSALLTSSAIGLAPIVSYTGRRRFDVVTDGGTAAIECDPELVEQIRELFEQGASEFFEDGVHSAFSRT